MNHPVHTYHADVVATFIQEGLVWVLARELLSWLRFIITLLSPSTQMLG